MKNALKCIGGRNNCSAAHVVDGKLVLSFPEALTPIVWQMDLAQTKASALEVRESPLKDSFALFLKTPKGETLEIASFARKAEAVDGLMAASRALQNASGHIRPGIAAPYYAENENVAAAKPARRFSWKTFILGALLILALLLLWSSFTTPLPQQAGETQNDASFSPAGSPGAADGAPVASGVPVSADEFLRKR